MRMFRNAINGILYALKTELNMRIHLFASIAVLSYLIYVGGGVPQFALACLAIFSVISAELMNTAMERLCDYVEPNYEQQIKIVKDLSAGAVLVNVLLAVCMGILIWRLGL